MRTMTPPAREVLMHRHHKLALLKARANFRKARNVMDLSRNIYEVSRSHYGNVAFFYGHDGRAAKQLYAIVASNLLQYRIDVDAYIAAGEILVCVERMLEKA